MTIFLWRSIEKPSQLILDQEKWAKLFTAQPIASSTVSHHNQWMSHDDKSTGFRGWGVGGLESGWMRWNRGGWGVQTKFNLLTQHPCHTLDCSTFLVVSLSGLECPWEKGATRRECPSTHFEAPNCPEGVGGYLVLHWHFSVLSFYECECFIPISFTSLFALEEAKRR